MRPPYRGDVDGLRAVAVLLVVAFHAFPRKVPGGFTGVDIFFVISGFLITSLIVRSKDKGDFSFADFYARRIKRIFPALIVVLLAGLAIGWIVMFPGEYRDLGKHNAAVQWLRVSDMGGANLFVGPRHVAVSQLSPPTPD